MHSSDRVYEPESPGHRRLKQYLPVRLRADKESSRATEPRTASHFAATSAVWHTSPRNSRRY